MAKNYVWIVVEYSHRIYVEYQTVNKRWFIDKPTKIHGLYINKTRAEDKALAILTPYNNNKVHVLRRVLIDGKVSAER